MTNDPHSDSPARASKTLRDSGELVNVILAAYGKLLPTQRFIIGIAGAPASGKSTLAHVLTEQLNAALVSTGDAAVAVPMDGYHLDNSVLDERGLRPVKGAPHTFDVLGFRQLLQRLAAPLEPAGSAVSQLDDAVIYIPLFDRSMDLARCAASAVGQHHRIVVVEGNYLLLERPVWQDLQHSMDLTVLLNVPLDTLEERLIERWIEHGHSAEAAKERAMENDIPNAQVVVRESAAAHFAMGA